MLNKNISVPNLSSSLRVKCLHLHWQQVVYSPNVYLKIVYLTLNAVKDSPSCTVYNSSNTHQPCMDQTLTLAQKQR